uniref:Uncharacterized protein n=1 Tax=Arundo donax TaxID=35708 RepID=A0A0A9BY04_ARUDO
MKCVLFRLSQNCLNYASGLFATRLIWKGLRILDPIIGS